MVCRLQDPLQLLLHHLKTGLVHRKCSLIPLHPKALQWLHGKACVKLAPLTLTLFHSMASAISTPYRMLMYAPTKLVLDPTQTILVETFMFCLRPFSLPCPTLYIYKSNSSFKIQLRRHFLLEAFQGHLFATLVATSDSFPVPWTLSITLSLSRNVKMIHLHLHLHYHQVESFSTEETMGLCFFLIC